MAKLKQSKLDVRREQWLSQGMRMYFYILYTYCCWMMVMHAYLYLYIIVVEARCNLYCLYRFGIDLFWITFFVFRIVALEIVKLRDAWLMYLVKIWSCVCLNKFWSDVYSIWLWKICKFFVFALLVYYMHGVINFFSLLYCKRMIFNRILKVWVCNVEDY